MIDLRSDTVTKPTPAMRDAMANAEVGDDVYGEDPTINRLEARVAELLGKEAAVFVTSGTLSNQLAMRIHCEPGDMALMHPDGHIAMNEGGGAAALAGVSIGALEGDGGVFGPEEVDAAMGVHHRFNPPNHSPLPRVVCVENSHNGGGGVAWSTDQIDAVTASATRHGLSLHMDGARLWHAAAATGDDPSRMVRDFGTVSVCFSKGLGAPMGSALVGSAAMVLRARRFKQQYGSGFRQAGILAAGALYALDHQRDRLVDDVTNARRFAEGLCSMPEVAVDLSRVHTNIVRFRLETMEAGTFVDRCHGKGVHMLPGVNSGVRAVTHLGVSATDVDAAIEVVRTVLSTG